MDNIRLQPQAIPLEESVLGAILIDKDAIAEVLDILNEDSFYDNRHAMIYATMLEMYQKSMPIDILTTAQELIKKGKIETVGGAYYLSELSNKAQGNLRSHALIVKQKQIQRELIKMSNQTIQDCYNDTDDVFDLLDNVENQLFKLKDISLSNIKTVKQIHQSIKEIVLSGGEIATIYKALIGNIEFITKTFNVIAGFQGTGKTALMLTIARNIAQQGIRVGIMSMEMSSEMLATRFIQRDTMIGSKKILSNTLTDEEKTKILEAKSPDNIYVDDSSQVTYKNVIGKVKTMARKFGTKIIIIDYVQLIALSNGNENQVSKVERLTSDLQNIAKELDIAIVVLSQLARTTDKPTAAHLRNGGIEQAASSIYILFDEHKQENQEFKFHEIPIERRGKIELIDAKNRYDEIRNCHIIFDKPRQQFLEDIPYDWYGESFTPTARVTDIFN